MRAEPPIDQTQHVTNTEVTITEGVMTMKFTRPLNSGDSSDLSLTDCRYFLYGWGGPANVASKSIGYHPSTPIVSADKICLPTPQQCPAPVCESLSFLSLHITFTYHIYINTDVTV